MKLTQERVRQIKEASEPHLLDVGTCASSPSCSSSASDVPAARRPPRRIAAWHGEGRAKEQNPGGKALAFYSSTLVMAAESRFKGQTNSKDIDKAFASPHTLLQNVGGLTFCLAVRFELKSMFLNLFSSFRAEPGTVHDRDNKQAHGASINLPSSFTYLDQNSWHL